MPTTITFDSTVPSVAREHLQNQIFVGEGTENYMFNMWHGSIKEQGCQISHENASVVTLLFKVVAKFQVIADQLSNTQQKLCLLMLHWKLLQLLGILKTPPASLVNAVANNRSSTK